MGGPSATPSVEASVAAMRWLFDGLGLERTGAFLDHDGRVYQW
jgi:hypothetical protein